MNERQINRENLSTAIARNLNTEEYYWIKIVMSYLFTNVLTEQLIFHNSIFLMVLNGIKHKFNLGREKWGHFWSKTTNAINTLTLSNINVFSMKYLF